MSFRRNPPNPNPNWRPPPPKGSGGKGIMPNGQPKPFPHRHQCERFHVTQPTWDNWKTYKCPECQREDRIKMFSRRPYIRLERAVIKFLAKLWYYAGWGF